MRIEIGYESYSFYDDTNGTTCDKTTADLLNLKVDSSIRCTLKSYDSFIELIQDKHNMTREEVLIKKINNQGCM